MAMTNALNYFFNQWFSELYIHHMLEQTISSPQFIHYPSDPRQLESFTLNKKPLYPITTQEQLTLISAFFGFSKSKLGDIFGVSRQCIYNWLNDSDDPDDKHYEKIKRLTDIAFEIDPEPSQRIFHVYENDIIDGYDKSLLDYLRDDDFDKDTVLKLSRTLCEMSKERWKRIDAMPKAKHWQNDPSTYVSDID